MHFSATKYNTSRETEYMSEHKDLERLLVTWEWNCTLHWIKGFFLHECPIQTYGEKCVSDLRYVNSGVVSLWSWNTQAENVL